MWDANCPGSTPSPTISHNLERRLNALRSGDDIRLNEVRLFLAGVLVSNPNSAITSEHLDALSRAQMVVEEYTR